MSDHRKLCATPVLLTWMGLLVLGAFAQQPRPKMSNVVPKGGALKLVVNSSKQRVMVNDSFILEVKLVSIGSERVSLFGQLLWGYAGGLTLHVTDQEGKAVEAEQHDEDMLVPSVLGNPESYVVLLPNHSLGVERKDSPKNLFRKPGVYTLYVEYQSPVSVRYAKTPNFWGREKGPIRSGPVRIEVASQ